MRFVKLLRAHPDFDRIFSDTDNQKELNHCLLWINSIETEEAQKFPGEVYY